MKIAFLLSPMAVGDHGPIDFSDWKNGRSLTGTELATVHIAQSLSEFGHEVHLFCKDSVQEGFALDGHVRVIKDTLPGASAMSSYKAVVSVSDPGLLVHVPPQVRRIHWCHSAIVERGDLVDTHVFVSPTQKKHVESSQGIQIKNSVWIPNPVDVGTFHFDVPKGKNVAWISSPDRGLHRLLEMWPKVLALVPDATLEIFYRLDPFLNSHKDRTDALGQRARYIISTLNHLGRNGENGVVVHGPVSQNLFAEKLSRTKVVAYTFDPTGPMVEAFCIALVDACAAGCVPICSDFDALKDNFENVATIIPGRPGDNQQAWIHAIVEGLTKPNELLALRARWAKKFNRHRVASIWENLLERESESFMPVTMNQFAGSY